MRVVPRMPSVMAMASAPRGVTAPPRAESEPAHVLSQLTAAFEDFKERHNQRIDGIEAAVNGVLAGNASAALGGAPFSASERDLQDKGYSTTFASYVRSGAGEVELKQANADGRRQLILASMSVGSNSSGGYLAPVEWDREVRKALRNVSPMRRIATVVNTTVGGFSTVWSNDTWGSGWVGETAARPETTTPTLASLEFPSGEIYANPAITQRLLDDADFDIESWLSGNVADEFSRQESIAFLAGNGTNKPFGLLTYVTGGAADGRHPGGNLTVVNGGDAAAVAPDGLIGFAYSLPAIYRQGATWLMNSTTAAAIQKLKDGQGNYLWRESFLIDQPSTLLGFPVELDEGMPNIAANAMPIAFGNFARGYLINDRLGVRTLRDPYTNKPFVNFYSTKRVGAGVLDPNAIRLLKIAA